MEDFSPAAGGLLARAESLKNRLPPPPNQSERPAGLLALAAKKAEAPSAEKAEAPSAEKAEAACAKTGAGLLALASTRLNSVQVEPQNVQVEPQNVQVEPQNVQVEPQKVQVEPQNVQVEPQKVQVEPQNVQVLPLKLHADSEKMQAVLQSVLDAPLDALVGTLPEIPPLREDFSEPPVYEETPPETAVWHIDETGERRKKERVAEDGNRLSVRNLRKNFGRKQVVRGVGFHMGGGEVAGLLGPNGAGKTTIFYMIVGFLHPTTGMVQLNNIDITGKPMYQRARSGVAYLPQEASIFRKLTVEQNIWAILEGRRDINRKAKKKRLNDLIEEFSIGRIRKQYGYTLSGGERRRTEIARALATEPKFLLLDEPFAGIDPIAVYEIKQIIKRLASSGIGILITDHNVRDTLEITSDAFIINQGVIVARGSKEFILANKTVRDVYLGSDFKM